MGDEKKPSNGQGAPHLVDDQPTQPSTVYAAVTSLAAELKQHHVECEKRWEEHLKAFRAQEATTVEHRIRLETMTEIKNEISALKDDLKDVRPKPTNWVAILGVSVALLGAIFGAFWALADKLSDRPTGAVVEKTLKSHENAGHVGAVNEIKQVREEQVQQRESLRGLSEKVDAVRTDMKEIKDDIRAIRMVRPQ